MELRKAQKIRISKKIAQTGAWPEMAFLGILRVMEQLA
jgi:hypothetical protein